MESGFTPERIAGLVEGAANVSGQLDLTGVLRSTVDIAMELTGARYGALGVLGDHGGLVDFVHSGISPQEATKIGHLPRGVGVLGTITSAAKTIRIDRIADHPDSVGFPEHHPPMETFLGVPVRVGSRVFGNLYLTEKPGGFTADDELLAQFLAVTAGAAISTLRLQDRLRRAALVEDRERIARDLHDSIIQDLFAVGLGLQASAAHVEDRPDEVRDRIEDAIERLDATITSLRTYIFDLRPAAFPNRNFAGDVNKLITQLAQPHRVPVTVDVDCAPGAVPGPAAGEVLAILKEAVSNALRHSGATAVRVSIRCTATAVIVGVSDDGAGFDTAVETSGFGLGNMADRVDAMGGTLLVESSLGEGTAVVATIPR